MNRLTATAILALSSTSLFATSIKHTGVDSSRAMTIEINSDGTVHNANAGISRILVDGTTLIDSLCVNLFTGITVNQTYSAMSIGAATYDGDGAAAAWLMRTFLPVVNAAAGATRQIEGAALQLLIWDTIHDSGDGFNTGRIQATSHTNSAVLAVANQWRLAALDQTAAASVFTAAPGARSFQQQIYIPNCISGGDCGTGGEVPEPSTLAMLAIGSVGVVFGAWRKGRSVAK